MSNLGGDNKQQNTPAEIYANMRNKALEEAAEQALACMNPTPPIEPAYVHFDAANNMAKKIASSIRALKTPEPT